MRRHSPFRLLLVHVMVAALFLVLLGRLWQVQVTDGPRYAGAAAADHVRHIVVPPVRGRIVDDRGRPLVRNRTAMTVAVDRAALRRLPDGGEAVLRRLARTLDRPYRKIADRVRLCGPDVGEPCWAGSPYQPIPVAEGVDERVAMQIVERPEDFPAVTAEPQPVRDHPYGPLAAHVLGYVAPGDGENAHPSGTTLAGRDGLEAAYEKDLRGTPGRREVVVDSVGQVLRTVREQRPAAGATLVTSLDADGQKQHVQIRQRFHLMLVRDVTQIADVRDGKPFAVDAEHQVFAAQRALLRIVEGLRGGDLQIAHLEAARRHDGFKMAAQRLHVVVVEMIMADQRRIAGLGAGRIGHGFIVGIGDQHGAVVVGKFEAGMRDVFQFHE